jgi:hypothetical protein
MGVLIVEVSHDFVGFDIDAKLTFGTKVTGKLILAPAVSKFPHLTVSAADLLTANDNLNSANQDFINNPKLEGKLKDAIKAWIDSFTKDANYINSVCRGDESSIDLSGYNKTKGESTRAVKPNIPVVKSGESRIKAGLDLDIIKQNDATQFCSVLYTPDVTATFSGNQMTFTKVNEDGSTTQISVFLSKRRKSKFRELKSKSDMKSQSIAFNAAGASDPSAPTDNGIL